MQSLIRTVSVLCPIVWSLSPALTRHSKFLTLERLSANWINPENPHPRSQSSEMACAGCQHSLMINKCTAHAYKIPTFRLWFRRILGKLLETWGPDVFPEGLFCGWGRSNFLALTVVEDLVTGYIVGPFSRSDVSHPAAHIKCPGLLLLLRLHCPPLSAVTRMVAVKKEKEMFNMPLKLWVSNE